MVSFCIADFDLPDYPNEKITYVKFLDDNDPRLLFLVTFNVSLNTSYMKVLKIEKSTKFFKRKISEQGEFLRQSFTRQQSYSGNSPINQFQSRRSFSFIENQPFNKLKQEILDKQDKTGTSQERKNSFNPNDGDSIRPQKPLMFKKNPNENLRGVVTPANGG